MATSTFLVYCCAIVRTTSLLKTSPTTMPRTPPSSQRGVAQCSNNRSVLKQRSQMICGHSRWSWCCASACPAHIERTTPVTMRTVLQVHTVQPVWQSSLGAGGRLVGSSNAFCVFRSPGARHAPSRACRQADTSPSLP